MRSGASARLALFFVLRCLMARENPGSVSCPVPEPDDGKDLGETGLVNDRAVRPFGRNTADDPSWCLESWSAQLCLLLLQASLVVVSG